MFRRKVFISRSTDCAVQGRDYVLPKTGVSGAITVMGVWKAKRIQAGNKGTRK